MIIFPVTNDSVARSGKYPPSHPLVDKISYMLPENKEVNDLYQNTFGKWYRSIENVEIKSYLKIIKNFVQKENFIDSILDNIDAIDEYERKGLKVSCTEKDSGKSKKIDLSKIFLTFAVADFIGYKTVSVTEYVALHNNYIEYVESQDIKRGKCNISKEIQQLTSKHRGLMGNAKLISVSNNIETYKGRFENGSDIIQIGYKTSEKIHLMLKYLLENKNSRRWLGGQQYLINWFNEDISNKSQLDFMTSIFVDFGDEKENKNTIPVVSTANKVVGDSFIKGKRLFDKDSNYYVAIIDKASNGRISLKYFRELKVSQLQSNLERWHKNYSWNLYHKDFDKMILTTPSISQIILTAYGIERNGKLELDNDNFKKDQFQNLVIRLLDGQPMPVNIFTALDMNIRKRLNYSRTWSQIQFATLALFSHYREEKPSMLDRENKDRSYLFGRLLAVLDQIEAATYTVDGESKRITNAQKFWTSYTSHPATMMQTLIEKTKNYEKSLLNAKPGLFHKLDKEKREIINLLSMYLIDKRELNTSLDYQFIFGYYAEMQFIFTKKENSESEEVKNDNE
jgi:CRISPR-associated protein Csd1